MSAWNENPVVVTCAITGADVFRVNFSHGLQEPGGPAHIVVQVLEGQNLRLSHIGIGGKVHHGTDLVLFHEAGKRLPIGYIMVIEANAPLPGGEGLPVSHAEIIDGDDVFVGLGEIMADKMAADVSASPGYQ